MLRVSDALPIQFWPVGVPTYNERPNAGYEDVPFFQLWNCEDALDLVAEYDGPRRLFLKVEDDIGNELALMPFSNVVDNIWVISTNFEAYCYKCVRLFLVETDSFSIENGFFIESLSPWGNFYDETMDDTEQQWAWGSGDRAIFVTAGDQLGSNYLGQEVSSMPEGAYRLRISLNETTVGGYEFDTIISVANDPISGPFTVVGTTPGAVIAGGGPQVIQVDFTIGPGEVDSEYILIHFVNNVFTELPINLSISSIEVVLSPATSPEVLSRSDFMEVAETQRDTRIVRYTNEGEFAGIPYDLLDPKPEFNIRLLSRFYKERNPQEEETESNSDGTIVKLSSEFKTQRRLELDPLPMYMHKKIVLALQHNSVNIENLQWVKEEGYDLDEINSKYPHEAAQVWLTLSEDNYTTNTV
jgi:hypothetical protein